MDFQQQMISVRRAGISISVGDSHFLSMEPTCFSCSRVGRSSSQVAGTDGVKHFRVNGSLKKNLEDHSFEFECSIMMMKF